MDVSTNKYISSGRSLRKSSGRLKVIKNSFILVARVFTSCTSCRDYVGLGTSPVTIKLHGRTADKLNDFTSYTAILLLGFLKLAWRSVSAVLCFERVCLISMVCTGFSQARKNSCNPR